MANPHSPLWLLAAGWLGRSSYMETAWRWKVTRTSMLMIAGAALFCLYMGLR